MNNDIINSNWHNRDTNKRIDRIQDIQAKNNVIQDGGYSDPLPPPPLMGP